LIIYNTNIYLNFHFYHNEILVFFIIILKHSLKKSSFGL
jgi:hypothetical protein